MSRFKKKRVQCPNGGNGIVPAIRQFSSQSEIVDDDILAKKASGLLRALLASRQMKTSERLRGTPRLPSITKIRENSALMSRADAN